MEKQKLKSMLQFYYYCCKEEPLQIQRFNNALISQLKRKCKINHN